VLQPGELPFDHLKWLSVLLIVLMIGLLLYGPQPRRTTKAGAFWAYLLPLNIGIFYALLRDSPWSERMNLVPEPAASDRIVVDPVTNRRPHRYGGWMVFLWFTPGHQVGALAPARRGRLRLPQLPGSGGVERGGRGWQSADVSLA
jgi:hypothetical protein